MVVYRELQTLAQDLGYSPRTLYAVSYAVSKHYRKISVPKRGGGHRVLSVPDELLKSIQRSIYRTLLAYMPVSPYATAYRFGVSLRKNAEPHCGKKMILKLDILNFYDHILYSDVKEYGFPERIYAEPLRILLATLCYHGDRLPQGAPTSPILANLVLKNFDEHVGKFCAERKIAYTRYCDDLTFSGNFNPDTLSGFVADSLWHAGFRLNIKKSCLAHEGQRQLVTGLVVNQRVSIPAEYRRKVRQDLYYCRKFGVLAHLRHIGSEKSAEAYLQSLGGRVNYLLQIEPENAELQDAFKWVQESLKLKRF